jgi:hypothetical protein
LNRKTKAFVARSPMVAISRDWAHFSEITRDMFSNSLGIVDRDRILEALRKVRRGEEVPMITLRRTLCLEGWLKDLRDLGIIDTTFKPKLVRRPSIQAFTLDQLDLKTNKRSHEA